MRRWIALAAAITVASLPVLAAAQTADTPVVVKGQKAPRRGVAWFGAESDHFVVYSNSPDRTRVQALVKKLERVRHVLLKGAGLDKGGLDETGFPERQKTTLYDLADATDLDMVNPNVPEHTGGLFESCEEGVQGFVVDSADGRAAVEAYARHFFYAHFAQRLPRWYIEGYAQYFSTLRFDGKTIIVGLPPRETAVFLRGLDTRYKPHLTYKDVLNDNYVIDAFPDPSLEVARQTFSQRKTGQGALTERDDEQVHRRQYEYESRAWLLTDWLLASPERAAKIGDYISATASGEDHFKAFKRLFGVDVPALDNRLSQYLRDGLTAGKQTDDAIPDAAVTISDMPAAADRLLLWDAALKGCPSDAFGKARLTDIRAEAARFPDSEMAKTVLADAELRFGDPQAEKPWLEAQGKALPDDFDTQYLLGRVDLAQALAVSGEARTVALDNARQAFSRAAKADANSAVNAFWYYRAQGLAAPDLAPDAQGAAIAASRLSPEVSTFAVHAALIYARAGDGANAQALLGPVADSGPDSAWSGQAKAWLAALKRGDTPQSVSNIDLTALKPEPRPWPGQVEWTISGPDMLGDVMSTRDREELMRDYEKSQQYWDKGMNKKPDGLTPGQAPSAEE